MLLTRSTYQRLHARSSCAPIAVWLLAMLVGVLIWGQAPASAQSAPQARTSAARASELVIDGAGEGHGVGMSQDGALGYAERGWSYSAILAHYYTGTAIGQAPVGAIVKVLVGAK